MSQLKGRLPPCSHIAQQGELREGSHRAVICMEWSGWLVFELHTMGKVDMRLSALHTLQFTYLFLDKRVLEKPCPTCVNCLMGVPSSWVLILTGLCGFPSGVLAHLWLRPLPSLEPLPNYC